MEILDKKKVLLIPPLPEIYFKKIKEIEKLIELVDEITVNDFGTFNYFKKLEIKINLGRQIIKSKTGMMDKKIINSINKEDLEEMKELLISEFLINRVKDKINLLELNPIIQGINLKENFNYSLYWPFILNSTTFMCWSNVDNKFFRVTNCNTLCKKSVGKFLNDDYLLIGNQTLLENKEKLDDYLKKIKNNELIKRIVFLNY